MTELAYTYWRFYLKESVHFWNTLGPHEYGVILTVVGLSGWLAMRSNLKQ